tara:strand:+ start:1327 stop:1482 length:156 start_codon:yes stop_codon:yes gene_type:complete
LAWRKPIKEKKCKKAGKMLKNRTVVVLKEYPHLNWLRIENGFLGANLRQER